MEQKHMKLTKYQIEVRAKGERHGIPGELIQTITRAVWAEAIGNFNPMFCRYKGKRTLVQSRSGDLSDPFRREEGYLRTLYIELSDKDLAGAKEVALGRAGGLVKSSRKTESCRANGKRGGRPKKIRKEEVDHEIKPE